MKLRYFIPAFIALVGAMLVSCSDEDTVTLLDEIQVSRSYVPLNIDGGEATIDITAQGAWNFEESDIPEWLTVTPMSGTGNGKVTFSAPAAPDGRNAELKIKCAGRTQNINVIQGLATVQDATCAEVIAGPESKTYRVTGAVTRIANTTYGNWYLDDGTGEIYIYGTLDKSGKAGANNSIAAWGLEVGDIVTVEGPKTLYGSTVELVDVTIVKIVKSLLKVESIDPEDATIPLEGGDVTVNLSCKGDGMGIEIPDNAKDWLSITKTTSGANPSVTFHANTNLGGDRSAIVQFKTQKGSQASVVSATINQKGSIVEVNCSQFLEADEDATQYRITAVIQKVANAQYGNVYLRDFTDEQVYVYGIGAKGDFEALGLKEGDIVTLVGMRSSHNGNPQMKGAQYESHIPVTDISIAEFLTKPDDKNVYYRVSGIIESIDNPTYGNLYLTDGSNSLYVYGCYPGYGATGDNRKNWIATAGIEVEDELTMIGYKDTFNDKIELCGGIYFSHSKGE